jgi:hypothetical protein
MRSVILLLESAGHPRRNLRFRPSMKGSVSKPGYKICRGATLETRIFSENLHIRLFKPQIWSKYQCVSLNSYSRGTNGKSIIFLNGRKTGYIRPFTGVTWPRIWRHLRFYLPYRSLMRPSGLEMKNDREIQTPHESYNPFTHRNLKLIRFQHNYYPHKRYIVR